MTSVPPNDNRDHGRWPRGPRRVTAEQADAVLDCYRWLAEIALRAREERAAAGSDVVGAANGEIERRAARRAASDEAES